MRALALLLSAAATVAAWGGQSFTTSEGIYCDSNDVERLKVLEAALASLGEDYTVQKGNLSFHIGGNPQGRYGVVHFSDDLLPPGLKQAAKVTAGFPLPINNSFLMGPQDAVFWLGCTPPPVKYFSIRSYLAYRFPGEGLNVTGLMPAAELGDPTNNAVIRTTGGPGSPFGTTTLVVSTGDQGTYRRVREAFGAAGFPEGAVNLDVIPAEKVVFHHRHRPWVADRADTVAWQFRVNEFINPAEAAPYLAKVWPVFLLQANPRRGSSLPPPQPLQAPQLRPRGTGHSEEWLRAPLRKLNEAVEGAMAERGLKLSHVFPMAPNVPDADRCMVDFDYCPVARPLPAWNRTECIGTCDWFTKDSLYQMPPEGSDVANYLMPKDRVLFVVGINHPLVGKSSFLNFLMTGIKNPERPGHTPNFSSNALAGSAEAYIPEVAEAPLLYAQEMARDCGGRAFCETVTEESIAVDEFVYFAERAYLEPTTGTGPSPDELISPVVLAFDPMTEEERAAYANGQQQSQAQAQSQSLSSRLRGRGEAEVAREQ